MAARLARRPLAGRLPTRHRADDEGTDRVPHRRLAWQFVSSILIGREQRTLSWSTVRGRSAPLREFRSGVGGRIWPIVIPLIGVRVNRLSRRSHPNREFATLVESDAAGISGRCLGLVPLLPARVHTVLGEGCFAGTSFRAAGAGRGDCRAACSSPSTICALGDAA
jgi:hypothetical protein